jgi:hypothetical protein
MIQDRFAPFKNGQQTEDFPKGINHLLSKIVQDRSTTV